MPSLVRRIILRLAWAAAAWWLLTWNPGFSTRQLQAEDNIGRFPPQGSAETQPRTTDEPSAQTIFASATQPESLAAPHVAPPPIPDRLSPSIGFARSGGESMHLGYQSSPPGPISSQFDSAPEWFAPADPDAPGKHIGLGEPLVGTSWLNRPYYTSLLAGSMIADDARGNAELHNGLYFGLHHGWDVSHYHGFEGRLAGGAYDVYDSPTDSDANVAFADANVLYYPWGDALWRPYYSLGLGLAYHHLRDNAGRVHDETLIDVPLGIGVKYQWKRSCAMRFDIKHNVNFGGGGLDWMDHVSISYGLEYRYGGRPKSYFPWNPSVHHY